MVKKRAGMGKRGIHAMIGAKQKADSNVSDLKVEKIPVNQLQAGAYQPRQTFNEDALNELAESIKAQGLVQPIIVKRVNDSLYEIIAGERRWRAAQMAGLDRVPVVIRQADSQATLAMALIENIQREDLNPIETAEGLKRLIKEFELTQQAVADAVGRSRTAVANLLRLLKLPKSIQTLIHENKLSMGHARAIINLPDELQKTFAKKAVEHNWTVREMEKAVQAVLVPNEVKKAAKDKAKLEDESFQHVAKQQQALSDKLSQSLGVKVKINHKDNGKGRLEISYKDMEALDELLKFFKL